MESRQTSHDGDQTRQKVVSITVSVFILVIILISARYVQKRPIVNSSALMRSQLRHEEHQRDQRQVKSSLLDLLPIARYSTKMLQVEDMGAQVTAYLPQGQSKTKRGKPGTGNQWENRTYITDSIATSNTPNVLENISEETAPLEGTRSNDAATCSICTESFIENEDVRILPCGHMYHRHCVDPWLLDFGNTCPLW